MASGVCRGPGINASSVEVRAMSLEMLQFIAIVIALALFLILMWVK